MTLGGLKSVKAKKGLASARPITLVIRESVGSLWQKEGRDQKKRGLRQGGNRGGGGDGVFRYSAHRLGSFFWSKEWLSQGIQKETNAHCVKRTGEE